MKTPIKKERTRKDDSLYGLLSLYKQYSTYIRILISEEEDFISLQLTGNPGNWPPLDDEKYKNARRLRRIKVGCSKFSIKYILPEHLVAAKGPHLGIKLPSKKTHVINRLNTNGYYILETSLKNMNKIIDGVQKLLNLTPPKKYEIIEKSITEDSK